MSQARTYNELLKLIEVTGPFLSLPAFERAMPQGFIAHDPDHLRDLRSTHEAWLEDQESGRPDPARHTTWIRWVLRHTLGYTDEHLVEGAGVPETLKASFPQHREVLRPELVLKNRGDDAEPHRVRLLIQTWPRTQALDRPAASAAWKSTPMVRMMELLHATGVRLGLVTNGPHWVLVDAPAGQASGFATFHASLWLDEHLTLRAFRDLLGSERFFAVAATDTPEALLAESRTFQHEVTDQLGLQVRQAVEILVQTFDRINRDQEGRLLADVSDEVLYEAAVVVMMRLVFLLSAEEQRLLPINEALYRDHYAVSTLAAQLREAADRHVEEVLEHRHDAWVRLLSSFRVVHAGVTHEDLRLRGYGGHLFDPDTYPFLEGRKPGVPWSQAVGAQPVPIDNRTVLHLLEALQVLRMRVPGGGPTEARRLSFSALDIEDIGHVYEGLLDHTVKRADGLVVGLQGTKGREPEVPVDYLEELKRQKGQAGLVGYLKEQTGRSPAAIERGLEYELPAQELPGYLMVCENRKELVDRVRPFVGLVREDTYGRPVVIPPGSAYVTEGTSRRSSGTHYTPQTLSEEVVRHTLDPLAFAGPAEGRSEWVLRAPADLLSLRICDLAMGSGAFLVQTCRYLSELLVQAWEKISPPGNGSIALRPDGTQATSDPGEVLVPNDPNEKLLLARRIVAERCLFGVDRNPLAVEMAKLSLWLITVDKNRPFTFLDHALRCGDSLLGVTHMDQIENFHLDAARGAELHGDRLTDVRPLCRRAVEVCVTKRRQLESVVMRESRDAQLKEALLAESREATRELGVLGDLLVGAGLKTATLGNDALDVALAGLEVDVVAALEKPEGSEGRRKQLAKLTKQAAELLGKAPDEKRRKPFHWALEFPEVFGGRELEAQSGFDALVGNPPFQGGQKLTGVLGTDYREFIVGQLARGQRGSADLCAYFFLRASSLLKAGGQFGLVATNTIAQGDTREVGLDQLLDTRGSTIFRALSSRPWPGEANLEVAEVWLRRGAWGGKFELDGKVVPRITSSLAPPGRVEGKPYKLAANAGKSFQGSIVLGLGFVLEPVEAQALIRKDRRNKDVLFPYLSGEDLNSRPDQSPSRWVINFHEWPLDKAESYPDCMNIVRQKVKPEREANKYSKSARERWWLYERLRPELYETVNEFKAVVCKTRHSPNCEFAVVSPGLVFQESVNVFALPHFRDFAVLSSSIHEFWAREIGSSIRTDLRYTSDCFETFPFPVVASDSSHALELDGLGEGYHLQRRRIMHRTQLGVTKIYNRCHDRTCRDAGTTELRDLRRELDRAVAAAYGWTDLALDHGYHPTKQGMRFTISETARREVLDRLLALNHQRYAEEQGTQSAGSPDLAPKARRARKARTEATQNSLFSPTSDVAEEQDSVPAPENAKPGPTARVRGIETIEVHDVMAAFRQATRSRGWLDREDLLKEVSKLLGYQRLGPSIEEALRGHLRAAIRRGIIETDGPTQVRAGTRSMADYELEDLREAFRSVMHKDRRYERPDVIRSLALHLGFTRVTETVEGSIRSAINSAIRRGLLGYEGSLIWRSE